MASPRLLPKCSVLLTRAFVKALVVHCFNYCMLLAASRAVIGSDCFRLNPVSWLVAWVGWCFCWRTAMLLCSLCVVQTLVCSVLLRLMSFQPVVLPRVVDRAHYLLTRPLALTLAPLLISVQTGLLLHSSSHLFTLSSAAVFLLLTLALSAARLWQLMWSADQSLCPLPALFQYQYMCHPRTAARFLFRHGKNVVAATATCYFLLSVDTFCFGLVNSAPNTPHLPAFFIQLFFGVWSTVLSISCIDSFVGIFQTWSAEPVFFDVYEQNNYNALVGHMRSEDYYVRRCAYQFLRSHVVCSRECRRVVFECPGWKKPSEAWDCLCVEILSLVADLDASLAHFAFVHKKRANNCTNGELPRPGTDQNVAMDRAPNVTFPVTSVDKRCISMFAPEVAGPWQPEGDMDGSGVCEVSGGVTRRVLRSQHSLQLKHIASSHAYSLQRRLHSYLLNTPIVQYFFNTDIGAEEASIFVNVELLSLGLESLCMLLAASLTEDVLGIVQKDLPQIFTSLLSVHQSLEKHSVLGWKKLGGRTERAELRLAAAQAVDTALYRVCRTYAPYMQAIHLPDIATANLLHNFLSTHPVPVP